LQRVIRM